MGDIRSHSYKTMMGVNHCLIKEESACKTRSHAKSKFA